MTKPSLLLPNVRDPQHEAAWKSIKALTDYQSTQMAGFASATTLAALAAQVAALQAQITALSTSTATTYMATQTIAKGQVVYEVMAGSVALADDATLTKAHAVLGVATASGTSGTSITVATAGQTATGLAGLTAGDAFLGPNGAILSTPPASPNYVLRIGYAINSTTLFVQPELLTAYATDNLAQLRGMTTAGVEEFSPWPQMPTLNTLAATLSVTVPTTSNFFVSSQTGLTLNGTLTVNGTAVMV